MKRLLIGVFLIVVTATAYAATITRPNTYVSGATILASEINDDFNTIYNEFNGSISNANISASAAIAGSKLDLTGSNGLATGSLVKAGTGTGTATVVGVLDVQVVNVGNDANTTEKILATYTLPANSLSANDKSVRIRAWGTLAANGNTKDLRMRFGGIAGTVIAQRVSITDSNVDWELEGIVIRTGATTQASTGRALVAGAAWTLYDTPGQTLSAAVDIVMTGKSPTTGAANDVVCKGMITEMLN